MIKQISMISGSAGGAVIGGVVSSGLVAAALTAIDPATTAQGVVLVASGVYGGSVCGGIVGALLGALGEEQARKAV